MARAKKPTPVVSVEVVETPEVTTEVINGKEVDVIDFGPVVNEDGSPSEVTKSLTKGKAEKNEGVGQFIRKLIDEGLGNKAILEIVHEQYGNKNTTYACVAWYRNKMKKAGQDVKKSSALDFITNFAKANNLSEENVEILKQQMKVA